jgi:hypothetical protein
MTPNLALRWITFPGVLLLAVDCLLLAFVVRKITWLGGAPARHPVVRWLQFGVLTVLVIVGSAWLLNWVGALDSKGFLGLHAIMAAGLAVLLFRRPGWPGRNPGLSSALFLTGEGRGRFRESRAHRLLLPMAGWILVFVLAYLFVLALGVFAPNWDSQAYRLPRVGYWLQERRISLDFANDPRLLFMPVNTELFMLWLTCFFPNGYPLINLVEFGGGCLTLLTVFELGRLSGLSREGRLLAVSLAVGVPVVILEFATNQSDLFSGGLLNAGLVFIWRSFRSRSKTDPLWAGLAIGLSLGAKGTLFYWIPGLLAWVLFLTWRDPVGIRRWLKIITISGGVALLVGGWKYADNYRRFANPFAPAFNISEFHREGGRDDGAITRFMGLSHFWQLVQPNSNPAFLSPALRAAKRALGDRIEAVAPSPKIVASFHEVRQAYEGDYVGEDTVSFGLLVPALFILGMIADGYRAARRADARATSRLALGGAAMAFLYYFFHKTFVHPFNFRYFTLVVPFVAVVAAAAWPTRRAWRASLLAASVVILLQGYTVFDLQNRNVLGGWRSLFSRPDCTALFESLTAPLSHTAPNIRQVALALPMNQWISAYFRLPGERRVRFVAYDALPEEFGSAGQFLKQTHSDALITIPSIFPAGPEPGVARQSNGVSAPFSLVLFTRVPTEPDLHGLRGQ